MGNLTKDIKILKIQLESPNLNLADYFVTGGALRDSFRGRDYKDIDIYCKDKNSLDKLILHLKYSLNLFPTTSEYASTFEVPGISKPVQIISKIQGSPEEVHKHFDFGINCSYQLLSEEKPTVNNEYSLRLRESPLTPQTLLFRTIRFMTEGYIIEKNELLRVLELTKDFIENSSQDSFKQQDLTGFYEIKEIKKSFGYEDIPF